MKKAQIISIGELRKVSLNKFKESNPRRELFPKGTKKQLIVGDCVVRAIVHVTGKGYRETFRDLMEYAMHHPTCQAFNSDDVLGDYLEEVLGAVKHKPKRKANGKTYEVRRFPASKDKSYIIVTTTHVTSIVGGVHLDSWNCGAWRANSYWEFDKELL